jgi:XTP/dITP diphosphohydrolase
MAWLTLVLASSNEGKLTELRALLADLPIQVLGVSEVLGRVLPVAETGSSFEENAILKARAVCQATRLVSLADDSGLEVTALEGRPGVRSARFAHEQATDAENNAALLRELEHVEPPQRTARFRCVLALATPYSTEVKCVEGACTGVIARSPRGNGGFGYDPLFFVDGRAGRSMAELSESEKNEVSHRGQAVRALRPLLAELVRQLLEQASDAVPEPGTPAPGSSGKIRA